MSSSQDNSENLCVVCFKTVDIYSVGECDHPVCFECSTRMRVLCMQTECPICRHDLSKVFFSSACLPYKQISLLPTKSHLFERRHKISFCEERSRESYLRLLEHGCPQCRRCFPELPPLREHLRKDHDLFYCDLCVDNLKIFTIERKCYTRQQLALHRRKGDPDDTSHKGHPMCEFCDQRYMDTDELYRHLRKDHLYCHLCDADGFHHYYSSYQALQDHFRRDHFLCEEGDCGAQGLTGVFRSEIDLIAHKAQEHGRGLSKQAARQARTLEVQFTLTPRPGADHPRHNHQPRHQPQERVEPEPAPYTPQADEPPITYNTVSIDTHSTEQFPTLGNSSGPMLSLNRPVGAPLRQTSGALLRTQENFPSLGRGTEPPPPPQHSFRVNITHQQQAGPSNAVLRTSKPNVSIQVHNSSGARLQVTETSGRQLSMRLADRQELQQQATTFQQEFPSLSKRDKALLMNDYSSFGSAPVQPKKPPAVVQQAPPPKPPPVRAPPPSIEAFPALTPGGLAPQPASSNQAARWTTVAKAPPPAKPKPTKVAAAPQINTEAVADFPMLKTNKQKNKKTEKQANITTPSWPKAEDSKEQGAATKKKKNKGMESADRPPAAAPPDLSARERKNNKENSQNGGDGNAKKKNDNEKQVNNNEKQVNNNNESKKKNKNSAASETVQKSPSREIANAKVNILANSERDFPSLGNNKTETAPKVNADKSNTMASKLAAMKINKKSAPPGFGNKAPPPGFNGSIPPCNGFTFTNSSGQSYSIPAHNYVQPADFDQRNKQLVSNFMKVLDCPESIHEFKQYSQMFREGSYSAESYYDHCKSCMGDDFDEIFPELLSLLPDISKQQELYEIHEKESGSALLVCNVCSQVLIPDDLKHHNMTHSLMSNFPELGAASGPAAATRRK